MIRWLGKAAIGLTKREYAEHLIESVQLLALAYRSAGLHWAARASCVLAAASIFVEGEKNHQLPVGIVPTMKVWAWNALELCHLPDFLFAVQLMNGFLASFPLTEVSKTKVRDDIRELDAGLGCLFLNLGEPDLRRLEEVPDILEALGLCLSRTALLYSLGHTEVLREDGSIRKEETDEGVRRVLSILKCQPVAEHLRGPLVLNDERRQTLATTILGVRVEVEIDGGWAILIAESILGTLEAFFATVIGRDVTPHTESFRITVTQSDQVREPVIETNELDMMSTITWPSGLRVTQFDQRRELHRFFSEVAAHVMGATCMIRDTETLIKTLHTDEAVQQRITMIAVAPTSYNRVASQSFANSLADWREVVRRSYPLIDQRPELPRISLDHKIGDVDESDDSENQTFDVKDHREMSVSSVIDVHAWNQARWKGCGYLQDSRSPYMALLFENAAAARKIFERWRARFGEDDINEKIAISIIRHLPEMDPHYYCVQITSRDWRSSQRRPKGSVLMTTRYMEPANSENLDRFLAGFKQFGAYRLLPGVGTTNPEFFFDLMIIKRSLSVKSAAEVGEHDIEALTLRARGLEVAS
jgi:hypothetical protein